MPTLELGRPIGADHPPFIIATLDCRDHASLAAAFIAVDDAARSGCDALRLIAIPAAWETRLFDRAGLRGLHVLSAPHDEGAVHRFDWLGAHAFYFSFREAIDLELVALAAATGKPLVVAAADGATEAELAAMLATAREHGGGGIALLGHALETLEALGAHRRVIGIVETSQGTRTPSLAITRGAHIIECPLGPALRAIVEACAHAWAALDPDRWTFN